MSSNNEDPTYIKLKDSEFSKETIEMLKGEEGVEELNEEWLPVAKAIENPERLPFLVAEILEMEKSKELRNALVRVQINAQLKREQNLELYKKQLFAATTIETLLFERLRLKPKKGRKQINHVVSKKDSKKNGIEKEESEEEKEKDSEAED